jgi:hypothetical protein
MTGVEIWDHINGTLAAIKWPAVVALAGYFLRRELAGLVRRLLKIEAAGATVEFDATRETLMLGAEISESGGRIVNNAIEVTRVASYEQGPVEGVPGDDRAALPRGRLVGDGTESLPANRESTAYVEDRPGLGNLRDDLSKLIEASFQAGFVAGTDAKEAQGIPSPTLHWVGAEPRITGWTYETGNPVFRLRLGEHMRRLRERAGITRADAGWAIRGSENKISRMEIGEISITERDVSDLITLYGVTDDLERKELLQLAGMARGLGAAGAPSAPAARRSST